MTGRCVVSMHTLVEASHIPLFFYLAFPMKCNLSGENRYKKPNRLHEWAMVMFKTYIINNFILFYCLFHSANLEFWAINVIPVRKGNSLDHTAAQQVNNPDCFVVMMEQYIANF